MSMSENFTQEETKTKEAAQWVAVEMVGEIARDEMPFLGPPTSAEQDIYTLNCKLAKEQERIAKITLEFRDTIDKLKAWVRHIESKRGAWGSVIYASEEAEGMEEIENKLDDIADQMDKCCGGDMN